MLTGIVIARKTKWTEIVECVQTKERHGSGSVVSIAQRRYFVSEELHGDDGMVVVATCESSPAKSLSALLGPGSPYLVGWQLKNQHNSLK